MRILVTGGSGYIGSVLVPRLREKHEVHAPTRDEWNITAATPHRTYDAVIHLAGGGGPVECAKDPLQTVRTNVLGTANVARVPAAVRIMASTSYVYAPDAENATEHTPTAPDTLYGAVKESAEAIWCAAGGVSLRLAHVYGWSPKQLDSVMDRFARAAAARGELRLHEEAASRAIQYVHVDNVCFAVEQLLFCSVEPGAINFGAPERITVGELAVLCGEAGARITTTPSCAVWQPSPTRYMDCSKAKRILDWVPKPALRTWVPEFIERLRGES